MLTLQLTSYIKDAANATACTLCVCREAFDEWSPVPLGTITFVVALLWSMDILVKKWVRMVRASEGSIFTAKPEPGKRLPLNWDYIGTLDHNTKKNFHRLIAVTDDRLKFASYYKMKDYPVLLLLLFSKVSTSIFVPFFVFFVFFWSKINVFQNFFVLDIFRPLKKTTPTANAAFVTILKVEKWNRNNPSSSGHS